MIDVNVLNSQKGVLFSFSDTALGESNFEVLRARKSPGPVMSHPDAVVLIDADVQGCARTFSSITFFDDEAIKEPGYVWEYMITTKYEYAVKLSDPIRVIATPWFGVLEGVVLVGETESPVKNVRVCAGFFNQQSQNGWVPMRDDISYASGEVASSKLVIRIKKNPSLSISTDLNQEFSIPDLGFEFSIATINTHPQMLGATLE